MSDGRTGREMRRRRASSRSTPRTLRDRTNAFVRSGWLTGIMTAALLGYIGLNAALIRVRMSWYADVALHDAPEAVVYALGQPTSRAGDSWRYITGARTVTVSFQGGRVSRIACHGDAGTCPDLLGLTDRSSEEDVLLTLGQPGLVRYGDGGKVDGYPSLGVSVNLTRFSVRGITLSTDRGSMLSAPFRYLRIMLP